MESMIFRNVQIWLKEVEDDGRMDEMRRNAYELRKFLFDEKRLTDVMDTNVTWPSNWITEEVRSSYDPMIYGKYREAMKTKEKKIKDLVVKIVETHIRTLVVRHYLTSTALAQGEPASPMREEEKIKETLKFWIESLGTLQSQVGTFKPTESLNHPKKHDLETEMLLVLDDHLKMTPPDVNVLDKASLDPVATKKKSRQDIKGKKKKDQEDEEKQLTPADYYRDLYQVWGGLRGQLSDLVIFEYPKMLNDLTKTSLEEDGVVTGFEGELLKVWETILDVWEITLDKADYRLPPVPVPKGKGAAPVGLPPPVAKGKVPPSPAAAAAPKFDKRVKTKKQVEQEFTEVLITRFSETSKIFERYLKTVPILTYEGAPTQKTYDLLYATGAGTFVYRMYDAAAPALPKVAALKWPFLKNVPDFITVLSVVPWKKDMLDRIQNFFLGYATDDGYRGRIRAKYEALSVV